MSSPARWFASSRVAHAVAERVRADAARRTLAAPRPQRLDVEAARARRQLCEPRRPARLATGGAGSFMPP